MKTIFNLSKQHSLFIITTVLPTLLSLFYYGFLASDVYVSESRFVVRSPERTATSPLGLILKGAGFSKAQDESYAVQEYILSRDALRELDKELNLIQHYSYGDIDVISRFSGLWDNSFEDFFLYYQKKVSVQVDATSSISTLTVKAFSPELAEKINQLLLDYAEKLVNDLNERGRKDLIKYAAEEVNNSQKRAAEVAIELSRYRNSKGVIDPEKQAAIPMQQAAKLQEELVYIKIQIAQMEALAKDNPQLPILKQRLALTQQGIDGESKRVAGGEGSLAAKATEYHRLAFEKEFADRVLASALTTLEQAKNEAQRKQLYLERIVQPNTPDEAVEPYRVKNIIATALIGLIVWGVLMMLIAGIKEHQD